MLSIWNTFCEDISKNKTVKEMTFEKDVVKSFLQELGWSKYQHNLKEQLGIYKGKWRPDFVFYMEGNEDNKEIILELKKPDHKQRKVDIEQIEAYMKLTDCRFGLYFGEKLEVFYLQERDGKRFAAYVTTIEWTIDNEAGANLIEMLCFKNYDRKRLEQFCLDHLYLNSFINLWKTPRGQQHLYNAIMEHFMISTSLVTSLQSHLKFTIIDNPDKEQSTQHVTTPVSTSTNNTHPASSETWLICYDSKYFDVAGCFKKYGQIYWRHKSGIQNIKKGDIVYLYGSVPESAIRFKAEVVESQIPYSKEMDVEDEFNVSSDGVNSESANSKFFLVRYLAETNSATLKHSAMKAAGLMGKRPTATRISQKQFKPLQEYIEENFNNTAKTETSSTTSKRKSPEPPFKFSMIGLKSGDKVIFDALNIEVTVASEKTIKYNNKEYKLTTFCKEFLPENMRNKSGTYQGPNYFSYKGKKLTKIRNK